MLQVHLAQPKVPGLAEAAAPDALGVRPFDPGPPGILGFELSRLLPLPCGLDRLVLGLRPDGELTGRVFCPGACLAGRTGATRRRVKADAHDGSARDIPARGPLDTGLPLGTAGLFGLPIQHKGG